MALTCPNCEKLNRCDCKSCNPDCDNSDLVVILEEEQLYQCFSCGHKFNEQDSLDFEWDRMHKRIKEDITPEMAFNWKSITSDNKKNYESSSHWGRYGFESAFFQHFGIRHNECSSEDIKSIELMLKRDRKISNLIK
jgi:hypothetical protein